MLLTISVLATLCRLPNDPPLVPEQLPLRALIAVIALSLITVIARRYNREVAPQTPITSILLRIAMVSRGLNGFSPSPSVRGMRPLIQIILCATPQILSLQRSELIPVPERSQKYPVIPPPLVAGTWNARSNF